MESFIRMLLLVLSATILPLKFSKFVVENFVHNRQFPFQRNNVTTVDTTIVYLLIYFQSLIYRTLSFKKSFASCVTSSPSY